MVIEEARRRQTIERLRNLHSKVAEEAALHGRRMRKWKVLEKSFVTGTERRCSLKVSV